MVINLVGKEGSFETDIIQRLKPVLRSFGLWSFRQVSIGDFVIRPAGTHRINVYAVESLQSNPFRGSDGNVFWKGTMREIQASEIDSHQELAHFLDTETF